MLSRLRLVGIDDGFFPPEYKELKLKTVLVGTLYRGRRPVDVKLRTVTVDGTDGTKKAIEILESLGESDAVFLDGVTVAGFNVVDPEVLLSLSKSVVVIYKFEPNIEKIERALKLHFSDWRFRYDIILKAYSRSSFVRTKWKTMRIAVFGDSSVEAERLISYTQLVSSIPEPLRASDIIASAISRNPALLSKISSEQPTSSQP
ncbi:MAG: DUF99 family protein [Sulfolobales archaeon]